MFVCVKVKVPTYSLSVNGLDGFAAGVQATVHVGRVLSIKPERNKTKTTVNVYKRSQDSREPLKIHWAVCSYLCR